jgi:hypothetical protein
MTAPAVEWRPHQGQQTNFLSSSAFEALFGGSAGPGKSECLSKEVLRQIDNPRYNAILFRRTFSQLEAADGLIHRSLDWYPAYGGRYNETKHVWKFPSGARIYFGHLQHEADKYDYQSAQFSFIGFDELTQFTESLYLYLFTRCRADPDTKLRCYVRSATNPGGLGHDWVKKRFITTDIVNRVRYFARVNELDTRVERGYPDALSRAFYPASMKDNPSIDPQYRSRILMNNDPVEVARLLDGDWDAQDNGGRVYPDWSYENISEDAEYNPELPVYWAVDDGYAHGKGQGSLSYHPRVFLLAQLTPIGGVNVFFEYIRTQELSDKSIENVLAWRDERTGQPYALPQVAYVDSSAAELKARIWAQTIQTVGATHKVSEGIKNVRRFIKDSNDVRLLKVHPRCTNLIYEMANYKVDEDATRIMVGEVVPLKLNDHSQDALRYLLWAFRFEIQ